MGVTIFPESVESSVYFIGLGILSRKCEKGERGKEGIAKNLKAISKAKTLSKAQEGFLKLRKTWGRKYPKVVER